MGPYRLETRLGSGAAGVVYRGRGPDGRAVAIKVLRQSADGARLRRRFEREAGVRVHHPNVVQVFDAAVHEDGTPYIVFEMLEGETLRARENRGRLSPAEAIGWGIQTARGMCAVHAAGIVHRDLKPSNLFLGNDGVLRILDFGISRFVASETQLTSTRDVVGTPSFLSPEQARGGPGVDHRTDVWALGVVLYEALTGVRPFARETALATTLAVVVDDFTPLQELCPGLPPDLCALVERCLAKPKADRWDDMPSLLHALESLDTASRMTEVLPLVDDAGQRSGSRPLDQTQLETGEATATSKSVAFTTVERKLVAVLYAEGVHSVDDLRDGVEEKGGLLVPLHGRRAIGLFGGSGWFGDEVIRAASAGVRTRRTASWMSLAIGRASRSGRGISGAVVEDAEKACQTRRAGISASRQLKQMLGQRFAIEEVDADHCEILVDTTIDHTLQAAHDVEQPLFGCEKELAALRGLMESVRDEGHARAALITGPPGIGKSRLLQETRRLVEGALGFEVFVGEAEPGRQGRMFWPLAAMLRRRGLLNADLYGAASPASESSIQERRQAVEELVGEVFQDPEAIRQRAPFIGELLGVPMDGAPGLRTARTDARLMADRIHAALLDYFLAAAERRPVALMVEDLQWADGSTLELLETLLEQAEDLPLLLVATARSQLMEQEPDLFSGPQAAHLKLQGLRLEPVRALAERIADRDLPRAFCHRLLEHAGGNPSFVEHIVSALRQQGLLDDPPDQLPLPPTVEGAIQARIDQLSPQEREICKRGSVFERWFDVEGLRALGIADPGRTLRDLVRQELLTAGRRRRGQRERQYRFTTPLVGEVANRSLAPALLRELHSRAAAHLAEAGRDADPEAVARHHERGGHPELAAGWYAAATFEAVRRADSGSVLRCSGRALELGVTVDLFALHMARSDALRFLGRRDEQIEEVRAAHAMASDEVERARARIEEAVWMSRTGRTEDAIAAADAARGEAALAGDGEVLCVATIRYAAALLYAGRTDEAAEALEEAAPLAERGPSHVFALWWEWRGQLAAAEGNPRAREAAFRHAVEGYERAGDFRRAAACRSNLADTYNRLASYERAEEALTEALVQCRRVGNRPGEGYALVNLGYSLTMLGREDEALGVLAEAEAIARGVTDRRLSLAARVYRLRALLGRGDVSTIASEAPVAAEEADRLGLPGVRASALTLAARAQLASGRPDRALSHSAQAMKLRDELGSLEEDEAELFATHAEALEAVGRAEEAEVIRARGRELVEALADQLEDVEARRRYLERVPAHRKLFA